ncbi:MAG: HEAT repeat domain-containing protein [Candidatus Lokiarchaeota archaeon]
MILTYFGSKGYIAGISNAYYHIPEIKRYIFLNFEDSKRGTKQFISDPLPYITFSMMLFVFVWAWISLFQTIGLFFTGALAISTMSSVFVFVTLFFGVVGYFTRFWGRKIKYKGIDIYFSAYLIAAIGINVLINFLIVNSDKLADVFNFWSLTNQIIPNYRLFSWAAIIEELTMIIFIIYYFISKRNDFLFKIKISKITQCGKKFDPIPLFNFLKDKNPEVRNHAEKTLIFMFERLTIRSGIDLNDWKYKNLLLDGLSDPDKSMRKVCYQILSKLSQDTPNLIFSWLVEHLESPNYTKSLRIANILLQLSNEIVNTGSKGKIINLIRDTEWRFKLIGIKLAEKLKLFKDGLIRIDDVIRLLNDPDEKVQLAILNLVRNSPYKIPVDTILRKINHPNKLIRARAISNLTRIKTEYIDKSLIQNLIPYMKDPSSTVRASIFNLLSKIGNFKKYSISVFPFIDALGDVDNSVREASISVLNKFYSENPKSIDLEKIISKLDQENPIVSMSILKLLGKLWAIDRQKILSILLQYIKFDNEEIQTTVSNILMDKYDDSPELILPNLIQIEDESKFLSKGIISSTIIKIAKGHPEIYDKLIQFLDSENEIIRLNVINSLDGIHDKYNQKIDIELVLNIFQREKSNNVKRDILQLFSKLAKNSPHSFSSKIDEILEMLYNQDSFLKVPMIKIIMILTEKNPNAIPIDPILKLFSDKDPLIRETLVKVLGFIGYKLPTRICEFLINNALHDEEWNVREAGISSIGKIIKLIENRHQIIDKLVVLLDDENSWVRRSSMNLLSSLEDLTPSQIPLEKVLNNINDKDPIVREGSANLLKIYGLEDIIKTFDYIIKLLGDPSNEVRRSAINTMVEIIKKKGLLTILSKMLKQLTDETSIETQQSIALILGRTVNYEEETIKDRVISLLKVRCEMTQNPIICETLEKLKET